jgi:hypothetical protein
MDGWVGRAGERRQPDSERTAPVKANPVMTLYEEVENILTNRLKNALRTGEIINAPDWVSGLATRHKLPAVYFARYLVSEGGLASYGPDLVEQYRQAGGSVDRILKGERPARQANRFKCSASSLMNFGLRESDSQLFDFVLFFLTISNWIRCIPPTPLG